MPLGGGVEHGTGIVSAAGMMQPRRMVRNPAQIEHRTEYLCRHLVSNVARSIELSHLYQTYQRSFVRSLGTDLVRVDSSLGPDKPMVDSVRLLPSRREPPAGPCKSTGWKLKGSTVTRGGTSCRSRIGQLREM